MKCSSYTQIYYNCVDTLSFVYIIQMEREWSIFKLSYYILRLFFLVDLKIRYPALRNKYNR